MECSSNASATVAKTVLFDAGDGNGFSTAKDDGPRLSTVGYAGARSERVRQDPARCSTVSVLR